MISAVSLFYKIHPFTPRVDEILDLLERAQILLEYGSSGVKMLSYDQFEKMNREQFKAWGMIEDNYETDGFKSVIQKQNTEIHNCIASIQSKYTDDIKCETLKGIKFSLKDLNYHLGYEVLKLRRLELVKNPKFTHTLGQHSRTKIKYDMVKIHWFDDHGEPTRTINKNVGNVELKIVDIVNKIFEMDGYETIVNYKGKDSRIMVDLLVSKGKNKWVVEIKHRNREDAIKNFVSMELWLRFKKIYNLE